mmetsp:Transcript_9320/g.10477  ORF Transcript_9320/g.10477 Transcript_9320/m.10477 type:complete len:105 (-) Transcript_9320:330-644(-)
MKLSEESELLQYPGFGPTSEPPLQYIFWVWHVLQSLGEVNSESEYESGPSHSTHAPVDENDSPATQFLSVIVTAIAVLDFEFAVKYAALDGLDESIPVVENDKL